MTKKELQALAFNIIGFAGDALSTYYEALEKAKQGNDEQCDKLLVQAGKHMQEAHHYQTDLLCRESNGENFDISLLIIHAQDHLMNAVLAEKLIKELISLHREVRKVK
jgi:cellobiose-specific phosphotransferase system component IIA